MGDNLEKLKMLERGASKAPWRTHLVDDTSIIDANRNPVASTFPDGGVDDDVDFNAPVEQMERDAAFIVAARNHIQELIAECERLRGLLWYAWHEFNAIRARSGAPLTHDGMPTCSEDSWDRMTEAFAEAIGTDARKPWPSAAARIALGGE